MSGATVKHVVLFSGGIGSFAAAKRVAEKYGTDDVVLLFTDTRTEDPDLYRFLFEAAKNVGGQLVHLMDGRDIWEVFEDHNMMGNTRVDACSDELKRRLSNSYIKANHEPDEVTVYVGIDWSEAHRYERLKSRWEPYRVEAPLCEPPYLTKEEMIAEAREAGLPILSLYAEGFPHANCGGFCVKAGHAQMRHLLKRRPETYRYHEQRELEFQRRHKSTATIQRDRRGGVTIPVTLRELRERWERGEEDQQSLSEWGGCGCFAG